MNELYKLNDRDDAQAKAHSDEVFVDADGDHTEDVSHGLDENDERGQDEREQTGTPQPLVLTLDGKDGAAQRAHVKGVEYLAHCQRQERHSRAVNAVGDLKVAGTP